MSIDSMLQDVERAVAEIPAAHPRTVLVGLLAEALRRAVPAIRERPTTAFQELWRASPPAGMPAEAGDELPSLLEQWREDKTVAVPGFVWLRSKRRPRVPIGSQLIWRVPAHRGAARHVCWLRHAQTVVSGGEDGCVNFWDRQTALPIGSVPRPGPVRALAASPVGAVVAVSSSGGAVDILDAETLQTVASVRLPVGDECSALAFSPGGGLLAVGCSNSAVALVGCADWGVVRRRVLPLEGVTRLAWSGDADCLACAGVNGAVAVVSADELETRLEFADHQEPPWNADKNPFHSMSIGDAAPRRLVTGVCGFADADVFASVGDDNAIRLWRATTGERLATLNAPWSGNRCLVASPSGRHFAVGETWGQRVMIFDRASREMVLAANLWDHDLLCLAWSPAQSCLAAGDADGCVTLFGNGRDPAAGQRFDHRDAIDEIALSRSGCWLITHGDERGFCVWDTDTAEPVVGGTDDDVLAWKLGGGVRSDDPREQAALDALLECITVRPIRGEQDLRYEDAVGGAYAHFQATPNGYVNWGVESPAGDSGGFEIVPHPDGVSVVRGESREAWFHLHGRFDRVLVHAARKVLVCVSSRAVDIFSLEGVDVPSGDCA